MINTSRDFLDAVRGYTASKGTSEAVPSSARPYRIATIDPYYTAGLPSVTFDGESVMSVKGYTWSSNYKPVRGDRVLLAPVGQTYIIVDRLQTKSNYVKYYPLPLLNGWVNYGDVYTGAGVTRTEGGLVKVTGLIKGGTTTAETPAAILPPQFRPLQDCTFLVISNSSPVAVDVSAESGVIRVNNTASAAWFSLENIVFNNDPNLTWVEPTMVNGWSNYGGYGYSVAKYTKDAFGRVFTSGLVKNTAATLAADSTIFNLPAGFRPDYSPHVPTLGPNAYSFKEYTGSGDVRWKYHSIYNATSFLYLDGGVVIKSGTASWTNAALLNGWVNYDTNSFAPARYWKDGDGVVHVQGLIRSGGVPSTILNLPPGYRPSGSQLTAVATSGGLGRLDVEASGNLVAKAGSNGWYSLDGISFPAEQ